MKSYQQKKKELARIKDKLAKSKLTIFTSFARAGEKGLGVKDIQTLKKGLRGAESEYLVGKKTILSKAIKEGWSGGVDIFSFDGSLGVVFSYGDESAAAKSVYEFSQKKPALKLFGAMMGDKVLDSQKFIEFAKLPSREALISQLAGLMKYPLSALANMLGQIASKR